MVNYGYSRRVFQAEKENYDVHDLLNGWLQVRSSATWQE